jgi:hypothetical protein
MHVLLKIVSIIQLQPMNVHNAKSLLFSILLLEFVNLVLKIAPILVHLLDYVINVNLVIKL